MIILLVDEEESVGPNSAVHSHRYYEKKIAFFEHVHNSHRTDIFCHCDSCCHKLDLWGIEILKRQKACVLTFEDILLFFQITVPDSTMAISCGRCSEMNMHFMHVFKFQKIFFKKIRGIYAHAAFAPTTGILDYIVSLYLSLSIQPTTTPMQLHWSPIFLSYTVPSNPAFHRRQSSSLATGLRHSSD